MIVNDEQQRVMNFIATVNRGGYRPTGREVNEWRTSPLARSKRKGPLLAAAIPAVPDRRVRRRSSPSSGALLAGRFFSHLDRPRNNYFTSQVNLGSSLLANPLSGSWFSALGGEYDVIPGSPGVPATYGPDIPAEKFLAHLRRLRWIERDKRQRYGITLLGHALLRAEASADLGDEDSSVMVLSAEDDLAYGRVLGVIAECGEAFVIDGYLAVEELSHMLKNSDAVRFLVNWKIKPSRLMQLAVQIRTAPANSDGVPRELRQTKLHDRYVIGDHDVYGLGSSLNGVGLNMTTLVKMPDSAAKLIRAESEQLWASADIVARTDSVETSRIAPDVQLPVEAILPSGDGRFLHDGCQVRHKSEGAAQRCSQRA